MRYSPLFWILLLFNTHSLFAQPALKVTGLWQVEKVTAGGQELTPPGRWARFFENGDYEGGNGWQMHEEGSWTFNPIEGTFQVNVVNGVRDEAPPFRVDVQEQKMTWQREEEGMLVKVYWNRIAALPKTLASQAIGLWQYVGNGMDQTNDKSESTRYIHLRWDGVFVEGNTPEGRITGFYHVNAKSHYLTLMFHEQEREWERWTLTFTADGSMVFSADQEPGLQTKIFKRTDQFPN